MSSSDSGARGPDHPAAAPSMLDLVRLSRRPVFPPGGVDLYRHIARLTELAPGAEVLDVACGRGVSTAYFATEHGAVASGVDLDQRLVDEAAEQARKDGIGQSLTFQSGRSDALPYRDRMFDVAIGEIGLANHCAPADAVRELVRVTRPGGFVVLVQLVWKAPVDEDRRATLSDHLGATPLMLVEWKRLLKEAGVEDVHNEDWSDAETSFRPKEAKPFPDFADLFSLTERLGILRRAWRRWGWKGVSAAVARENTVHNVLTGERILGLDLLRGRVPAEATSSDDETASAGGTASADGTASGAGTASAEGTASAAGGSASAPADSSSDATSRAGATPRPEATEGAAAPAADAPPDGGGGDGGAKADAESEPPSEGERSDTAGLPLFGN